MSVTIAARLSPVFVTSAVGSASGVNTGPLKDARTRYGVAWLDIGRDCYGLADGVALVMRYVVVQPVRD